jgi:D-alanyl-D-alanine dipeptidase
MQFLVAIFIVLFNTMSVIAKENITRTNELIEIVKLDPTLKLDIRYATKNNFLNRPIYKVAKAFLQKPVAEDLIKVNKELHKEDYGLLIFDGYRPWSVTKLFWDEIDPAKRKFVADPKIGSIHNRGCAVDLTLYDLKSGKEIKMPSEYDTFSEAAYPTYMGGTFDERFRRDFLIKVMESHNFKVHANEWWHFDHKDFDKYEILDIPLENIDRMLLN